MAAAYFLTAFGLASPGAAQEQDAAVSAALVEGEVITFETIEKLRPYLPKAFWSNRDFFFYEGMQLEIGPFQADYSPPPEHAAATERFRGQPRIGPDGSLENYVAGQPFSMDEIDCQADPRAGVKIMWNFDYQWHGDGFEASYYYSYWDRGEQLPLYFEGCCVPAVGRDLGNRLHLRRSV